MRTLHAFVVERDSTVTPMSDIEPRVRAIAERISRINYVIDCHWQGIALQSRRRTDLLDDLTKLGVRP